MQACKQDIEKLLAEGSSIQIKPRGYSMYPVFVPGRDEAVIEPVDTSKRLKRGDVALYRRRNAAGEKDILVLHRIWKVNEQGVFFVGDNQSEVEGPLKRAQILGIMVRLVRKGRSISVKNPIYRLLTGIWLLLRPMRPIISKSVASAKRILGKENKEK